MQLHRRKRIEIIIETPARGIVIELLDRVGATGYTVLPALGGRGLTSEWNRSPLTDAQNRVVILVLVRAELAEQIMPELGRLLADYHGVVSLSDVEVVRGGRF